MAKWALDLQQFDGVIALGCVIKVKPIMMPTSIKASSTISHFALEYDTPIINGVLTTKSREQAWARAGGNDSVNRKSHKGEDCAHALMEMIQLQSTLA